MTFRRVNGKLVSGKGAGRVVVRDGHRMAVTRPRTPEAAEEAVRRAEALIAEGSSDQERFNEIWLEQARGDGVIFMGLLGHGGRILDPNTLEDIGEVKRGDSFVSADDLMKFASEFELEQPS